MLSTEHSRAREQGQGLVWLASEYWDILIVERIGNLQSEDSFFKMLQGDKFTSLRPGLVIPFPFGLVDQSSINPLRSEAIIPFSVWDYRSQPGTFCGSRYRFSSWSWWWWWPCLVTTFHSASWNVWGDGLSWRWVLSLQFGSHGQQPVLILWGAVLFLHHFWAFATWSQKKRQQCTGFWSVRTDGGRRQRYLWWFFILAGLYRPWGVFSKVFLISGKIA